MLLITRKRDVFQSRNNITIYENSYTTKKRDIIYFFRKQNKWCKKFKVFFYHNTRKKTRQSVNKHFAIMFSWWLQNRQ